MRCDECGAQGAYDRREAAGFRCKPCWYGFGAARGWTEGKTSWAERFWARVEQTDGCWLWRGNKVRAGYGVVSRGRRKGAKQIWKYAHRLSYELHHGAIPCGMDVCHTCDTPSCVNPAHLFLGTRRDNVHDMVAKNRQRSTLRPRDVIEIRAALQAGARGIDLAAQYGVTPATICSIRKGRHWRHLFAADVADAQAGLGQLLGKARKGA